MVTLKDPAAVALGRKGGAKTSEAKIATARENGHFGGRPRSRKQRCPCGAMTLKRATARAHKCESGD